MFHVGPVQIQDDKSLLALPCLGATSAGLGPPGADPVGSAELHECCIGAAWCSHSKKLMEEAISVDCELCIAPTSRARANGEGPQRDNREFLLFVPMLNMCRQRPSSGWTSRTRLGSGADADGDLGLVRSRKAPLYAPFVTKIACCAVARCDGRRIPAPVASPADGICLPET